MGIQRWNIVSEDYLSGVRCFHEIDGGTPGKWCKSEDVEKLEAENERLKNERDTARRTLCKYLSIYHYGDGSTDRQIAQFNDWDCFKNEEG